MYMKHMVYALLTARCVCVCMEFNFPSFYREMCVMRGKFPFYNFLCSSKTNMIQFPFETHIWEQMFHVSLLNFFHVFLYDCTTHTHTQNFIEKDIFLHSLFCVLCFYYYYFLSFLLLLFFFSPFACTIFFILNCLSRVRLYVLGTLKAAHK